MKLQERTVAEGQRPKEGEIDQRRLLCQVVKLAEDIAEMDGMTAEDLLGRQMLNRRRQRIFNHHDPHIGAVIFGRQRHSLQNFQPAPDLSNQDARAINVILGDDHVPQHMRFQPLPILAAAARHSKER